MPYTPIDEDEDGTFDILKTEYGVKIARPLPSGSYEFNVHERWHEYAICNFVIEHGWTVTSTAPSGTLHELFFDPVNIGSGVAADATNGLLKPAALTDANGASATLSSISYDSDTVKLEVTPDDALAGHIVDIIELDGTVSLSLDVADAMVDSVSGTFELERIVAAVGGWGPVDGADSGGLALEGCVRWCGIALRRAQGERVWRFHPHPSPRIEYGAGSLPRRERG